MRTKKQMEEIIKKKAEKLPYWEGLHKQLHWQMRNNDTMENRIAYQKSIADALLYYQLLISNTKDDKKTKKLPEKEEYTVTSKGKKHYVKRLRGG